MNFPQKRNVNVAAVSKRKHDLSHSHIGTTDFGRIKPIECRYMVPGDEFNINVANETRVLNAMPSPTIGKFDVVYRSFFVPINHIWSPFYDFIKNQQTISDGELVDINSAPYIVLKDIISYFINPSNGLCTRTEEEPVSYDFLVDDTTQYYCSFTRKGRILYDFLNSLGINIPFGIPLNEDGADMKLYIILPLVAFWKFYFDWIVPSRFIRDHNDYIERFISALNLNPANPRVYVTDFMTYLLHEPLAYYLDDVFTTSTEFPFSSNDNMQDSIYLSNPAITSEDSFTIASSHNSEELQDGYASGSFASVGQINMFTLQTLGKLQDLLNRNLIAGTKVQDWLLTEFGIRPNTDALHLSTYLGSKRSSLNVSDVISNADTEAQGGTPLGAYAGYVRNNSQFDFSYKANEHGFYFITYELVPKSSYYQGLASQFDMGNRFDFFQPEFDNQQGEPIPFRRLFFSHTDSDNQQTRFDNKFGFALQYYGFKYAPDVISGDFRTRFGKQLKSWYLARDMDYISDFQNHIDGIDEEFCLVKSKYQDWHYIFSDMNDELDPFLVAFHFQIMALRPMKSITEGFEPTYQQSGKNVQLDFSGAVK